MPSNEHVKELYIQLMRTVDPSYIKIEEGDKDFELFTKVYWESLEICNNKNNG